MTLRLTPEQIQLASQALAQGGATATWGVFG